jgi:hypothetical protein
MYLRGGVSKQVECAVMRIGFWECPGTSDGVMVV